MLGASVHLHNMFQNWRSYVSPKFCFWSKNWNFGQVKKGNKKFREIRWKYDIWVNLSMKKEKVYFIDGLFSETKELEVLEILFFI